MSASSTENTKNFRNLLLGFRYDKHLAHKPNRILILSSRNVCLLHELSLAAGEGVGVDKDLLSLLDQLPSMLAALAARGLAHTHSDIGSSSMKHSDTLTQLYTPLTK